MPCLQISFVLAAVGLLLQPLVHAQTATAIIPSSLPACAKSCTLLQQAQGSCESNPAAEGTCFCQSTLLTGLKTSSSAICPNCDAADLGTIAAWYNKLCANGGVTTTSANPNVVTVTSTSTPVGTTTTAATATATSAGGSPSLSEDVNQTEEGPAWWRDHWKWVLMVIILAVAFGIIGIGGTIYYRRRKRRRDGADDPRPDMTTWAPSQHNVHDFGGPAPGMAAAPAPVSQPQGRGKGKESERAPAQGGEVRGLGGGKKGKKVKKVFGRS